MSSLSAVTSKLTDVLGHKFQNNQLLADLFAANGYFVFMPDLFVVILYHYVAEKISILKGGTDYMYKVDNIDWIVEVSITQLRDNYNVEKLAGAGYFYGAKYIVRHLCNPAAMEGIDAGFIAYPWLVEEHELEGIGGPLSIAVAETDPTFPTGTRYKTETILNEIAGRPFQITVYGHVVHGFIHYNPDEDAAQYPRESAFLQALQ